VFGNIFGANGGSAGNGAEGGRAATAGTGTDGAVSVTRVGSLSWNLRVAVKELRVARAHVGASRKAVTDYRSHLAAVEAAREQTLQAMANVEHWSRRTEELSNQLKDQLDSANAKVVNRVAANLTAQLDHSVAQTRKASSQASHYVGIFRQRRQEAEMAYQAALQNGLAAKEDLNTTVAIATEVQHELDEGLRTLNRSLARLEVPLRSGAAAPAGLLFRSACLGLAAAALAAAAI
jgi:chromosome segregation ATPase